MSNSLLLSHDELTEIYQTCDSATRLSGRERRTAERWPFEVVQSIGAYGHWGLPKRSMFVEVRCHDISRGGISFFLRRPPKFRFAVIEIGKPHQVTHLLIQVLHYSRFGDPTDQEQYIVGCSFVQRVHLQG